MLVPKPIVHAVALSRAQRYTCMRERHSLTIRLSLEVKTYAFSHVLLLLLILGLELLYERLGLPLPLVL